ncbi:MAG TPA: hydrolase [Bacteroides sp.]|nr:hydrolase [Bacteroides sp.]
MYKLNRILVLALLVISFHGITSAVPVQLKALQIKQADSQIHLDGVLDEEAWKTADIAADFHQRFPADSSIAITRTEVKLTYDEEFFYIGAVCIDHVEGDYVVSSLRRDFESSGNDALNIIIDPFSDLTNGFLFGISPYGVQRESLIINGGGGRRDENTSWDNKWYSKVTQHEGYWIAEIAIPFKTLRFKEGIDTWRINFVRMDYKQNEYSNWNWIPRNYNSTSLAYTGELMWDKPLNDTKKNISLIPYATSGVSKDYEEGTEPSLIYGIGGDAKVGIGSALNLDLTVNPDFSQVEVDQQVTNLDRFEIYYPEKRQFFLENSDLFGDFGTQSIRPFFSRRIGIAEDTATGNNVENPIYFGARLSGRIDKDWRIGAMTMQTADDQDFGLPSINYGVAAVQRRVFARSNIAAIFVNKQPVPFLSPEADSVQLNSWNRVAGLEYNLASLDNRWNGKIFYHHSFSPDNPASPFAHGADLRYNDEHWDLRWSHNLVGDGYNAEVGYVRRTGFKRISPEIGYDFYPASKIINRHGPSIEYEVLWDQNNIKLDEAIGFRYLFRFTGQSFSYISLNREYVRLTDDFDPSRSDGPELPEGSEYTTFNSRFYFRTDIRKPVSLSGMGSAGEYYNGNLFRVAGNLNYRFRPYGVVSINYSYSMVRLPDPYHDADHVLIGPKLDITFTKNLYFATLVQYNSQINNVNVNARFQWRYKPASDIYIVYTDNYYADVFNSKNRALVFKITYWFNV